MLRSIGKSGLRLGNPDFGFGKGTRKRKTDFTSETRPQGELQLRNPNPDLMDFPFTVRLGNPKNDLQNHSREQRSSFY